MRRLQEYLEASKGKDYDDDPSPYGNPELDAAENSISACERMLSQATKALRPKFQEVIKRYAAEKWVSVASVKSLMKRNLEDKVDDISIFLRTLL